jgi:hypothetical protein
MQLPREVKFKANIMSVLKSPSWTGKTEKTLPQGRNFLPWPHPPKYKNTKLFKRLCRQRR